MARYVFSIADKKADFSLGFTLVETIVTLFIGSFLALGSGFLITNTATIQRKIELQSGGKDLADAIFQRCFNSKDGLSPCAFGGAAFDAAAAQTFDGVPITLDVPTVGALSADAQTQYGTVQRVRLAQLNCQGATDTGDEIATATLRLSMRTGPRETDVGREVNLGRIILNLAVDSGTAGTCLGQRTILGAQTKNLELISDPICGSMSQVLEGGACRNNVATILGSTNPGPCAPSQYVLSLIHI